MSTTPSPPPRALPVERPQTFGEELANSISHGLGFLLAVASLPLLLTLGNERSSTASIVGACVFSVTMMLLYFSSAMYHALPAGRAKRIFNKLDHSAIYVFIAGSYTPFALGALRGGWGWTLFGLVWGFAIIGVLLKSFSLLKHPYWSTGLYVAMGWLVLIAAGPLIQHVAFNGILLLVAGGVAYTAGAVFFLLDSKLRYAHLVWHLFVLTGSTCHFFAALWYAG
ncbi:hemolysin III family protein [soil metagenome]